MVGLVGLPGAGKSTVASLLVRRGARLIEADRLGHALLEKGGQEYEALVARFGAGILTAKGSIDRKELAELVFNDRRSLEDLNRIVHPKMTEQIRQAIVEHQNSETGSEPVLVIDAALLPEWGLADEPDVLIGVTAPKEVRATRLKELRGWSTEELRKREEAQWEEDRKSTKTMLIIDNRGTMEDLDAQVERIWQTHLRP
ncbi:MAG TPA: dephospho-CoA kinase [bacterium]|nr:dephospho-CoA kinase [bacterium]HQO34332.1 dephospho-CoA kinase [bacterium]